ncbi:unnamed protein product, partial [Didymodactylos carnosus]
MSTIEDTHLLKPITDVQLEPRKTLMPIGGYEAMPLLPIEIAVETLVDIIPDIQRKTYIAKLCAQDHTSTDSLTIDESTSIILFTMEWNPESLYSALNRGLRSEDRRALKIWFPYLKLFLTTVYKLSGIARHVWRGVTLDLNKDYMKNQTYIWCGFSSTTQSLDVLESEEYLGRAGTRTLFNIDYMNAKPIRNHSFYQSEDELILLSAFQFQVTGKLDSADGLHIIELKEDADLLRDYVAYARTFVGPQLTEASGKLL